MKMLFCSLTKFHCYWCGRYIWWGDGRIKFLKPALQEGALRCIGSTTYKEYRGHFEKDRALVRRFQKIDVAEPNIPDAIKILNGLKSRHEDHHKVRFTGAALKTAVDLSARYINDRKLPDKAIDVIDEVARKICCHHLDAGKQSGKRISRPLLQRWHESPQNMLVVMIRWF